MTAAEPASVPHLSPICATSVRDLLASAEAAGLMVRAAGDRLTVKGPAAAVELGKAILARKAEVLAHLTAPARPPWDAARAVALLVASDDLVERLGSRGSHPDIQAAVVRAADAYAAKDMTALVERLADVEAAARRLAGTTHPEAHPCPS